jgi:quercetin dioxygenase-like cupin family protein
VALARALDALDAIEPRQRITEALAPEEEAELRRWGCTRNVPSGRAGCEKPIHLVPSTDRAVPSIEKSPNPVTPRKYGERNTMSNEQGAPETKGVTVKLLATVDLGPEIEGMAGRHLRMRMVTIEPGGVFGPLHDHKGRPGTVYILQGTITDHRNGVATDYGPGVGWPEDRNTLHWLENRGAIPAVEISVDIVRQE